MPGEENKNKRKRDFENISDKPESRNSETRPKRQNAGRKERRPGFIDSSRLEVVDSLETKSNSDSNINSSSISKEKKKPKFSKTEVPLQENVSESNNGLLAALHTV